MKRKIHLFGDSHAQFSCHGIASYFPDYEYYNHVIYSITMHRIGRDKILLGMPSSIDHDNDIIIITHGEVDCRSHIYRQIQKGRELDEIINTLVNNYLETIYNYQFRNTFILSIVPPVSKKEYEDRNGPIQHHLPFYGTDQERLLYIRLVNEKLRMGCEKLGLYFIDPYYGNYTQKDGMMDFKKSDGTVHIGDNKYVLSILSDEIKKLIL